MTILVVEDDGAVRRLAREVLSMSGHRTLEAVDGDQALEICRKFQGSIQLVITDLVLPKIGGHELGKKIKDMRIETQILYMSGYGDEVIQQLGLPAEGLNFIRKPFTPDELTKKVIELICSH